MWRDKIKRIYLFFIKSTVLRYPISQEFNFRWGIYIFVLDWSMGRATRPGPSESTRNFIRSIWKANGQLSNFEKKSFVRPLSRLANGSDSTSKSCFFQIYEIALGHHLALLSQIPPQGTGESLFFSFPSLSLSLSLGLFYLFFLLFDTTLTIWNAKRSQPIFDFGNS